MTENFILFIRRGKGRLAYRCYVDIDIVLSLYFLYTHCCFLLFYGEYRLSRIKRARKTDRNKNLTLKDKDQDKVGWWAATS